MDYEDKFEWSCDYDFMIYNPTIVLLEWSLRFNKRMMDLIEDDDFAQMLSDVLGHREFCTRGGEILLRVGSNGVRAIVAHLRNRGETYVCFLHGIAEYPLKVSADQVVAELEAIGWRQPTAEELTLLKAVEELSLRNGREALQLDREETK